ncbi:hypothetical protein ABZS96_07540 [Streptomyces avermitilis]|uniref:hypothetical protein n=1 Tax=Streptomyces avermitilis TaxID=33903 RepID=UPI0033A8C965
MQAVLLGSVLLVCLAAPLVGASQRPRLPSTRFTPERSAHAPFAVAFGCWLVPVPMALLLQDGRADLKHSWWAVAMLMASPVVAFALVRMVAPQRLKRRRLLLAARAAALMAAVVAVEMAALDAGFPLLSVVGPMVTVSFAATATVLGVLRFVDHGYFPLVLLRTAAKQALMAGGTGYWMHRTGATLTPDPADSTTTAQVLALLWWSVVALSGGCALVAVARLVRWLRSGPPARPAPPGVAPWPPAVGDVWMAELTHDDNTYKERPVVVLEHTPGFARVLGITSVDKSDRRRGYLKLHMSEWKGVLTKDGWLNLEIAQVPYCDFLWRRGECPDPVWDALCTKAAVRERPAGRGPAPGFAFRHRLWSAMNAHAGRDSRNVHAGSDSRRRRVWTREKV